MDRRTDRPFALSEAFRAFVEVTSDYATLLATIADELARVVGDACVVVLVDEGGVWLEPGAAGARVPAHAAVLRAAIARRPLADATAGNAGKAFRTGEAVLLAAIDPEELAAMAEPAFADAVRTLGIHSYLAVPLGVRTRRLGALALYRVRDGGPAFTDDDIAVASTIADHAALAVVNAQLVASLQEELRERVRAQEKAKTFVSLVENSTDLIAMGDFDGRCLFMNAAGRQLVGLALDADVTTLESRDLSFEVDSARAALVHAHGSWQGEGLLRHVVTGEPIPTQVSSFLVRDADGVPLCFATVQHDLRETKRLESELRQAQRMEALGRLAGGVAHDFNNLLTVILSYGAMLTRSLPPGSRAANDVEQIERAGKRATELTRQLLAFSRKQVLEPVALDLDESLRAMGGMIRGLLGEAIELRIVTGGSGAVMADAGQIEQVVMNLVVNARDAMAGSGALELATSRVELKSTGSAARGVPPGSYVTLSVTDTGAGIEEKARPHLFEPFFTTKPRGKGTGLGLSTVMGIVKQSGGHITVDSEPGKGTTFRIFLPATTLRVEPVLAADLAAPVREVRGERVLVVEDEREVRVLVCNALVDAGYDVIDAHDGEHALEVAAATGRIDLLLTDVIMPRMGGRELATRFHALRPATRVLFMSGYTDDRLGDHGVLDPGLELIQKPLTPESLLRRVRAILT